MGENLKTTEFIAAQERLRNFTNKTESISRHAYGIWGIPNDSQEIKSPSNLLFDKCVREMLSQKNLIFSPNGALVIPNPDKKNQTSPILHDMKTLISCNTEILAQRIHKATEIIYLDYMEKLHLMPVEIAMEQDHFDQWDKKLGMPSGKFVDNPGFLFGRKVGIVLTEERRRIINEDGSLKNKFYELMKKYHPDVSRNKNTTRMTQKIIKAFDILSDPQKFIQYRNS